MARNEEKQLGRLNRLWLQKEKEGGRVAAVFAERPHLAALHTAADIKKWIPSIKRELEHYLEQSQLIHYSERKIEEFQEKIDTLKKEYQRYLWKLRRLDPSCKEHPWKLRGYTRKRTADGKLPSWVKAGGRPDDVLLPIPLLSDSMTTELSDPAEEEEEEESSLGTRGHEAATASDLSSVNLPCQDAPLEFSNVRSHPKDVWRRSSYNTGTDTTKKLKDILLSNPPDQKGIQAAGKSMVDRTEDQPTGVKSGGILGLDCYSSSEEDD
ncbi:hypothetical protein GDO78_016431 [Eleutherodactylus coqui]|uniref:Uncharacterized protein n=1 Tax=Eleutherodactylus coqui TaxID=57060 RepID=A0A8J6BEU2_ELECQ|nr:hypothetical protein GDO78_016431 [Eleutherodactylus coqui]